MKKNHFKIPKNSIYHFTNKAFRRALSIALLISVLSGTFIIASATTIEDLEKRRQQNQQQINNINNQISQLENEASVLEEQVSDLDAELSNMIAAISVLEDDIQEAETAIAEKEAELEKAETDLKAAMEDANKRYDAMKLRIRFMYERDNASIAELFLGSKNISDFLSRADYIESLYDYDRRVLDEYLSLAQEISVMKDTLEEEKTTLQEEIASKEDDMAELVAARGELDSMKASLRSKVKDYEARIKTAENQAKQYKKQITADAAAIKKLQEEAKKKNVEVSTTTAAGKMDYKDTGGASSTIKNSGGSELGKKIAQYACQFVGNPYVSGGTSLTNGADCSGFTYRVYADFGYSLPRTSFQQRSVGKAVGSLAEAQPGDLICYEGHVAMYIGNGQIVHASTPKGGIKIGSATYRSFITIRRIV